MAKKSVHISAQAEQYVKDRTPQAESPSLSAHVNNAFEQLAHLARAEKPELTRAEWSELYNVYAGSNLTRIALPLDIAQDLLEHYGFLSKSAQQMLRDLNKLPQGMLDSAKGGIFTRKGSPFDTIDKLANLNGDIPNNLKALYGKLSGLSQAQQFAVIDAVRVFWASGED